MRLDLCSQVFLGMLKFVQNYPIAQNQAVGFFDIQYLQKQVVTDLVFDREKDLREKNETTCFGWVRS